MVATFKVMVPRNPGAHDLVDLSAHSDEPLNRSVETCSGLTECSRNSFGLPIIYVYSTTIFLYMIFPYYFAIKELVSFITNHLYIPITEILRPLSSGTEGLC